MDRTRTHGTNWDKAIGQPEVSAAKAAEIKAMRASGFGILKTAKACGVGTSVA